MILPGETKNINFIIAVPSTIVFSDGKENEEIDGKITVKTTAFEESFNLDLEIEKSEAKLSVSGIRDSYTKRKDADGYPREDGIIDIKNNGDVILSNFDVVILCDNAFGSDWLTINSGVNEMSFSTLEKDQKKEVPYAIVIPVNALPDSKTICKLGVSYHEPNGLPQTSEKIISIITE